MTISRWTVSLTLFLLFLLFSALSTEVDWQNLAKSLSLNREGRDNLAEEALCSRPNRPNTRM